MDQYFLKFGSQAEYGVTVEDFVRAERLAGFYPKAGMPEDRPCTAGFSGLNITGSVRDVPQFFTPTISEIEHIPANSNPFHYDSWSMGTDLTRGWMVMHPGFDNKDDPQPLGHCILVNTRTGQRFRVELNDSIDLTNTIAGCKSLAEITRPHKEGWKTLHPTTNKRVEVVTADYVDFLERRVAQLAAELDAIKTYVRTLEGSDNDS